MFSVEVCIRGNGETKFLRLQRDCVILLSQQEVSPAICDYCNYII
jgi:hypothetical protein